MQSVKRIGVLIPPANIVCELEYARALPAGLSVHFNRLRRAESALTADSLLSMKESIVSAARELAFAPIDVVAYACTSGSFLSGDGQHGEVAEMVTTEVALPAVTTSTAVLDALHTVGATRVFLVAPYPEDITQSSVAFLRGNGFGVAGYYTFGCADSAGIRNVSAESISEVIRQRRAELVDVDAFFICCTNLPSLGYIRELEEEIGVPVISSNSATLWAAVRATGNTSSLPAMGTLGSHELRPA